MLILNFRIDIKTWHWLRNISSGWQFCVEPWYDTLKVCLLVFGKKTCWFSWKLNSTWFLLALSSKQVQSSLYRAQVIGKLSEGKASHIPYRDSKLTRLLQSSLSGHGCVSVRLTSELWWWNYQHPYVCLNNLLITYWNLGLNLNTVTFCNPSGDNISSSYAQLLQHQVIWRRLITLWSLQVEQSV